jgi:hypothetical protein
VRSTTTALQLGYRRSISGSGPSTFRSSNDIAGVGHHPLDLNPDRAPRETRARSGPPWSGSTPAAGNSVITEVERSAFGWLITLGVPT